MKSLTDVLTKNLMAVVSTNGCLCVCFFTVYILNCLHHFLCTFFVISINERLLFLTCPLSLSPSQPCGVTAPHVRRQALSARQRGHAWPPSTSARGRRSTFASASKKKNDLVPPGQALLLSERRGSVQHTLLLPRTTCTSFTLNYR